MRAGADDDASTGGVRCGDLSQRCVALADAKAYAEA